MRKQKKLQLNAQTVRNLTKPVLAAVAGGATYTCPELSASAICDTAGPVRCTRGWTGCQNTSESHCGQTCDTNP